MDMQNTGAAALTVYDRICLTRKNGRATAIDYIESGDIFTDFCELHGDRTFGDDHAVIGGIARLGDMPVTVIGIDKGRDLKERLDRHFGCVLPEGYRKALRLIKQAEKFNRPVICFVDTQGANCGKGAEERGAGEAIARNLYELSAVRTPIITVMIGEGGSGGALALAVADRVWMLSNAYYSVISPESCASILFKDPKRAPEAAEHLHLTANDLVELGIVEKKIAGLCGRRRPAEFHGKAGALPAPRAEGAVPAGCRPSAGGAHRKVPQDRTLRCIQRGGHRHRAGTAHAQVVFPWEMTRRAGS